MYRLLVVDDDPWIRDCLESLAFRNGYEVFCARSGEEALEKLDEARPDLVTLDVVLPGMDGVATLHQIKQRLPDVPIVMVSGQGQASTIVTAMRSGAADFLRKPFEIEELELSFQKVLGARELAREVETLRKCVRREPEAFRLFGASPGMLGIRDVVEQVADTDITVLLRGESGTGKEVIARVLHELSDRCERDFVKVNCAALPAELLESELFGYEKGAFTGAQQRKLGKFEFANGGTIFLDEISEVPRELQAKLLHILQDGAFSRLGGHSEIRVDTRVIVATNRDLEGAVRDGAFREDLYYRLNVVTVSLPPLRERLDAIPLLADHFLRKYGSEYGKEAIAFSHELMERFLHYEWPGNIRELENMVKRIVVLGSEQTVLDELAARVGQAANASAPPEGAYPLDGVAEALAEGRAIDLKAISKSAAQMAEKRVIERVLNDTRWNRKEAAERLQISYKALLYKMKENGLGEHP